MIAKESIIYNTINKQSAAPFAGLLSREALCRLNTPGAFCIGMSIGEMPIGAVFFRTENAADMVIDWIYIHPDYRAQGYGTELLAYIKELAGKSGVRNLIMEISADTCDLSLDEFVDDRFCPTSTEIQRVFMHTIDQLKAGNILDGIAISENVHSFSHITNAIINDFSNRLGEDTYEYKQLNDLRKSHRISSELSSILMDSDKNTKGVFIVHAYENKLIYTDILHLFDNTKPAAAILLIANSYRNAIRLCRDDTLVRIVCRKPETELLLKKIFPKLECTDLYRVSLSLHL